MAYSSRPASNPNNKNPETRRNNWLWNCLLLFIFPITCLVLVLSVYFLMPFRTNLLILGIDYTEPGSFIGRSDTIILSTVIPFEPYVGMISIPRDLWVSIPGVGENRINTAHFFAEANSPGSGPQATRNTVKANFGIDPQYYVRFRFDSVREIVDSLGGLDIVLDKPMASYDAGSYHLTGNKALAFIRHRLGSDDFFRMENGQFLIKSVLKQAVRPSNWARFPTLFKVTNRAIDTNIPLILWPRIGLAFLRAGSGGLDSKIVSRDMVTPFTTDQGASVLIPQWDKIRPKINEMFGK